MRRRGRLAVGAVLLALGGAAPAAQTAPDSAAVRGVPTTPASVDDVRVPADTLVTPGGTLRRALLVPGWGQVHVGQPLKAPVVVAALGGAAAYLVIVQRRTTLFRRAALYGGCLDEPDRPVCEDTDLAALLPAYVEARGETVGTATLRTRRDDARGARDLAVVGVAAVYALQALDAYIAAQLLGFDVSDDLSLRVRPAPRGGSLALRVRL